MSNIIVTILSYYYFYCRFWNMSNSIGVIFQIGVLITCKHRTANLSKNSIFIKSPLRCYVINSLEKENILKIKDYIIEFTL